MFNLFQMMTSKKGKSARVVSLIIILTLVITMVLASLVYAVM